MGIFTIFFTIWGKFLSLLLSHAPEDFTKL